MSIIRLSGRSRAFLEKSTRPMAAPLAHLRPSGENNQQNRILVLFGKVQCQREQTKRARRSAPAARATTMTLGNATDPGPPAPPGVLVADDDAHVRSLLGHFLKREGYAVWLAADGHEALDVYRRHQEDIHLVLLDVRMPRRDGPATLAALQ